MVRAMFDSIAKRYELVNTIITFGLDMRWRREALDALGLGSGARVLDLACGTGNLSRMLRDRGMHPVGADISSGMLAAATARARRSGPSLFVLADGARLPLAAGSLDGIVSGFALRNFADLPAVLAEAARVLRPQGRISLLEVSDVRAPVVRTVHSLWFNHAVPAIGGLLSERRAYRYLPRSVEYLPAPEELDAMLRESGFGRVGRLRLAFGAAQILTGTRR